MRCPRCGKKTSVVNSRMAGADGQLMGVAAALSWFTQNWVSRTRKCTDCTWRNYTVELTLRDFKRGWKPR